MTTLCNHTQKNIFAISKTVSWDCLMMLFHDCLSPVCAVARKTVLKEGWSRELAAFIAGHMHFSVLLLSRERSTWQWGLWLCPALQRLWAWCASLENPYQLVYVPLAWISYERSSISPGKFELVGCCLNIREKMSCSSWMYETGTIIYMCWAGLWDAYSKASTSLCKYHCTNKHQVNPDEVWWYLAWIKASENDHLNVICLLSGCQQLTWLYLLP